MFDDVLSTPVTRRTFWGLAAACAAGSLGARPARSEPSAQALLAESDAIRNPQRPFSVTTQLVEYRDGRQIDESTLNIYSKLDPDSNQYRNLIRFAAPARDVDKLMLKNGNELWFYDPADRSSVRISPRQRLLGRAANGDVVTANLARDYAAELGGEEEIKDGELKPRRCRLLQLAAQTPEALYDRIALWVDAARPQPVKAQYFSASGTLLKTVYYRRVRAELEEQRPTEAVIIDGTDDRWITVMRYSDFAWRDIPEAWLQRDYLARFKPEAMP